MRYLKETLATTACALVMGGSLALAQTQQKNSTTAPSGATTGATANKSDARKQGTSNQAGSASNTGSDKQVVRQAIDGEWLTVNGTVKSIGDGNFVLNYGKGELRVEMDGWGWRSADELRVDDKVTVSGRMDKDFYEQRKIEASSVFIPRRSEYIYANPADEEGGYYSYSIGRIGSNQTAAPQDDEWVSFTGKVTTVDEDQITVDTGTRRHQVDISGADEVAELAVDVGDRVAVTGEIDDADLFDQREVEANSVVILRNWDRDPANQSRQ